MLLHADGDPRDRHGDLAGHERLAAARRLVVEQDAVRGVQAVRLAVVHRRPVRVELGHAVGRPGVERGGLVLRRRGRPVELRGRGLVVPRVDPGGADGLEHPHGPDAGDVAGVVGHLERHLHVRLGREVVHLLRLDRPDEVHQAERVGQVAVVQHQRTPLLVRVLVDVVEAPGVERGRPADEAVHLVSLGEQQFGEVGAVLTGDARDQRPGSGVGHARLLVSCWWGRAACSLASAARTISPTHVSNSVRGRHPVAAVRRLESPRCSGASPVRSSELSTCT